MKVRSLYPVIVVPLLSMIVVGSLLWAYVSYSRATANVPRGLLPDSISEFTSQSQVVAQTPTDQQISLAIGLNLRNQAGLAAYLQQIYTPHSPIYHNYLNTQTFDALYAPLPSSEATLAAYLRSQGFTVTGTYANHLVVDARGSVAQVEQTFQVQLNNYAAPNGLRFYANANAPSLPATISPLVASVAGLDDAVQYSRIPLANGSAKPSFAASAGSSNITCPQPGAAAVPTSYTPPQIATAYNLNQLYAGGDLGEGQTVGLLELDGYSSNDIALYASCFGGNNVPLQTIPIDGYNEAAGPNAIEVELDMETVLGLAPRLAALRVYEAANNLAAYNDAWARIIADRVPVVSTSWVFCEGGAGVASELQQENIFFETAAVQGQTVLSASGDLGANGCYNPQNGSGANPAVDDPASQPFVTGVGGTRLLINPDDSYQSEQVWNDRAISDGASGGGVSQVWRMPAWQQGPGVANAYTTGYREVPDVSLNADPQTGYDVYCSAGGCANRGWQVVGGTSAAAPAWAAMVALANEAAAKANGYTLGFLNPSLYAISHGTAGTSYASAFHDVVPVPDGTNDNDYVGSGGTYPDTTSYDLATGLGSYNAANLVQSLLTLSLGAVPNAIPTSAKWYFAEGRVGGQFQEYLTLENPSAGQTAQVQVTYLFPNRTGPTIVHSVPPLSRATISVNTDVHIPFAGPGTSLSMIVTSLNGVGIVAERPMYFTYNGISSGSDTLGTTQLGQDYYFADVESERNYSSFITILNPPGGKTANVTVNYYAFGSQLATTTVVVPPGTRGTTSPMALGINQAAAVVVHSDQPVVVERPMYFSTARSNISGPVTGAATLVGAPAPSTTWLFAEGYTGANFHDYLTLANFSATATANVTVTLQFANGATDPTTVQVAPQSQYVFDVNRVASGFAQATSAVSAQVKSDNPIVAQREEYFRYNGTTPGGTDVLGQSSAAQAGYSFAEGYTTNGFSEFLTLQNPNTSSEDVVVRMYMSNSITTAQVVTVAAQTRVTIDIGGIVQPIAQVDRSAGYAVALSVQAAGGTIVAERPMYFDYNGFALGGTDVMGYVG